MTTEVIHPGTVFAVVEDRVALYELGDDPFAPKLAVLNPDNCALIYIGEDVVFTPDTIRTIRCVTVLEPIRCVTVLDVVSGRVGSVKLSKLCEIETT